MRSSCFSKSSANRVFIGNVGDSAAHIEDEYVFENLNDFEKALSDIGKPEFKKFHLRNRYFYRFGDSKIENLHDFGSLSW